MSGFTPEEIEAHRTSLEDVATWSAEGLRWHEYLLGFAARWGQAPISSQAPLAFVDGLLKQQQKELNEANKILEQTIKVLEGFPLEDVPITIFPEGKWYVDRAKPLLDNLKALKKEAS